MLLETFTLGFVLRRAPAFLAFSILSACAAAPPPDAGKPAPPAAPCAQAQSTAEPLKSAPAPLEGVDAYIEKILAEWKAPGLAVVVVQNGEIKLLRGYGKRELGGAAPIDEHTRFSLASLTKTFTAAATLKLAEEKKLGLEDPVKRHLPSFAVKDPRVTAELTLRDVLAHKSGLDEAADVLWYGTGFDRSEVLARLANVGQGAPFRSTFSYSNVLYTALGEVVARAAGKPWEAFVRERLLEPAGLGDAGFGLPKAPDGNVAAYHALRNGAVAKIETRDVDNIGPAASIYASASDLSRWLRVWLGRGEIEGRRVFSESIADQMLSPSTLVGLRAWQKQLYPESHFLAHGFGWMLQDYRGRLVAWNTGGLDGASCTVAVVPEEKLAVAVLANVPWNGLPEGLVFWLVDAHLGFHDKDWSAVRLKLSLDSRARNAAAREALEGKREVTALPFPAEKILGIYQSPLLGEAIIEKRGDALSLRIGKSLRATVEPWKTALLRAKFDDEGLGSSTLTWKAGPDGNVKSFSLEDHGTFERKKR